MHRSRFLLSASACLALLGAGAPAVADEVFPQPGWQGNGPGNVHQMMPTPDGKFLVSGIFNEYDGQVFVPSILRINANGSWDMSFDANRALASAFSPPELRWVTPDGAVLLSDATRLLPDGSVEPVRWLDPGLRSVNAVAVQPDGKLIVAGDPVDFEGFGPIPPRLLRVNADGKRDASFSAPTDVAELNSVRQVAVQPDGKVVVASDLGAEVKVLRLLADGSLDPTFPPQTVGVLAPSDMAVLADGRILVAGGSYRGPSLACLHPDGTPDPTFAASLGLTGAVADFERMPDGKLFVAGEFTGPSGNKLIRLNPDGGVDTSFAVSLSTRTNVAQVVARPDNGIAVATNGGGIGQYPIRGIARLSATGALDRSFAPMPAPSAPTSVRVVARKTFVTVKWPVGLYAWQHTLTLRGKALNGKKLKRTRTDDILNPDQQETRISAKLKKKTRFTLCVISRNGVGNSAPKCVRGKAR